MDGNPNKLKRENSSMNKREFIKLSVMGVLGSLLPTNPTKKDMRVINTKSKVGMGITNPSQKLIIKGGYYPDGGIGI